MRFLPNRSSIRIAGTYFLFGVLWILVTDFVVARLVTDASDAMLVQVVKGWLFVAVSALVIWLLVRHERNRWSDAGGGDEGSQGLLRRVLASISDAVLVVHIPSRTIYDCNPGAEEMLGYSRDELIGRSTEAVHVDREHYERFGALGEPVLTRGEVFRTRWELRRADGEVFPTEQVVSVIPPEEGGEPEYAVSVVRDISERLEAERRLTENRDLLQAIIRGTVDGIFVKDLDGTLEFANEAAARMLGRDHPHEVVGHRDEEFLSAETLETIREVDRVVTRTGEAAQAEEHVILQDGTDRIYDVAVAPLLTADDGDRPRIVGVARDVTEQRRTERELEESNRLLDAVVRSTGDAVFAKDREGRFLLMNAAGARMLGRSVEEIVGNTADSLIPADEAARVRADDRLVMERDEELSRIDQIETVDGEERIVETVKAPLRDGEEVIGVIGIARDITERRQVEEALRRTEEKYEKLFRATPLGIVLSTMDGSQFIEVNEGFENLLGYRREELVGRRALEMDIWVDPADRSRLVRRARGEGKTRSVDARLSCKNGDVIEAEISADVLEIEGQEFLLAVTRDVTDQRRMERQLERMALHDELTGLANRTLFRDRLEHALAAAERQGTLVAVLFLDLDRFKVVNDTLGHPAGDQLLQQAARRIASCLREEDTVARLGGDEFGIALERLESADEVEAAARRLTAEFERPFELGDESVHVSASMGIALNPAGSADPDDLLRFSDIAMYRAKDRAGSTFHLFDPEEDAEASVRLHLENELRKALDKERFVLHYQPVVDLDRGRIAGVEALIRWEHPVRGVLYPGEFITMAEESGLIVPMGEWVVRRTVEDLAAWDAVRAPERPLTVGVNVSTPQLEDQRAIGRLAEILESVDFDRYPFVFEITESAMLQSREAVEAIRRHGIEIALDDLGTGYASLEYLTRLDVDLMKVDRGFIAGIGKNVRDEAIVEAAQHIAERLEIPVVAEGIETEEQLSWLREHGYPLGQGFLFGEPVRAAQMKALLAEDPSW